MKPFKVGGYYELLDRTAFFIEEDITTSRVAVGTVFRLTSVLGHGVTMLSSDGLELITFDDDRKKFRPANNKQISQYKKRMEESE